MSTIDYQPWYCNDTFPVWDIPLNAGTLNAKISSAITGGTSTTVNITDVSGLGTSGTIALTIDKGLSIEETVIFLLPVSGNTLTVANSYNGGKFLFNHVIGAAISGALPDNITGVNLALMTMTFRDTTKSPPVDIPGTGTFFLKTAYPAEVYYKPSPADVANPFSGLLIVKALLPPSNSNADEIVYDFIGGVAPGQPFVILAS